MRVRCIHCSTDSQVSLLALEKTGGEFQCPSCEETFNALRGSRSGAGGKPPPPEASSAKPIESEPSRKPEAKPVAVKDGEPPTGPRPGGFPPAYDLLKAAGGLLESGEAPILQADPDPGPSDGPLGVAPTPVEQPATPVEQPAEPVEEPAELVEEPAQLVEEPAELDLEPDPEPESEPPPVSVSVAAREPTAPPETDDYEDFAPDPLSVIHRPSAGSLPVGGPAGPVQIPTSPAPDPEEVFARKKAAEDTRNRKLAEQEARKAEERKVRVARARVEQEHVDRERAAAKLSGAAGADEERTDSGSIVIEDQLLKETAETIDPGLSTQPDIPIEPRPRNLEASYEEYEDESDFIPKAPQPIKTRSGLGAPAPRGAPVRRRESAAMRPDTPPARPRVARRPAPGPAQPGSSRSPSGFQVDPDARHDLDPRLDEVPGALGKRVGAVLAVIGVLFVALSVFVLVANDFKLRRVSEMVAIAFGGGAAAIPTPETVSEHFEVIDYRIYRLVLSDDVTVAVVQGTLENRSDLIYDRVQVRVVFSDPTGATVAELRRPAGNVFADKRMETFTSPAALDAAYLAEGTDGRNLGLAPFTRFPFQVIFLDPPSGCCFDYGADVKVVGGEPRTVGAPLP